MGHHSNGYTTDTTFNFKKIGLQNISFYVGFHSIIECKRLGKRALAQAFSVILQLTELPLGGGSLEKCATHFLNASNIPVPNKM